MTGQVGTRLVAAALVAALTGMVGAAAAQDSGGGARHVERFTDHELRMCNGASALMQDLNIGEIKARYLADFHAFNDVIDAEPIEVFTDRVYLMFHHLQIAEIRALADSCASTLRDDEGPARFTLSRPDIIGEGPFAAFTATRAAERAEAAQAQLAREQEQREQASRDLARLDAECRAIVDEGVAKATSEFRKAQTSVEVWIRAGAFGSPPGQYDIQNGCIAIDSAGSRLNARECPADYANALMNFRASYYLTINDGGGFSCN